MKVDLLDYAATQVRNRETFLLNFPNDFRAFDLFIADFQSVWSRIGVERDRLGRFHTGLLPLVNLFVRHAIFGFQHLACYQSFLAWLTFRPGLEALLILGKWLDDPSNVRVWRDRETDREAYQRLFTGKGLVSSSLPRSEEFRSVLSRLNNDFMHPNPEFTYRDIVLEDKGESGLIAVQYFDVRKEIHEAHLLAYVNLMDEVLWSSFTLINNMWEPFPAGSGVRPRYADLERRRAEALAGKDPLAKKIMQELGQWRF